MLKKIIYRKRVWISLALMCLSLWFWGFFMFIGHIPRSGAYPQRRANAIVVLTGGKQRILTGLSLFKKGYAPKVFISGVNKTTSLYDILLKNGQNESFCCIVLGHEATDTIGNAIETKNWVKENGIQSLILVTESFHMPRSQFLFSKAMPFIKTVPYPVISNRLSLSHWYLRPKMIQLLILEYSKYIFLRTEFTLGLIHL